MNARANTSRPITWLMLALLAWGALLAVGTFLYRFNQEGDSSQGGNLPLYRGLIVLGCTLAFLGLWSLALAFRKRPPPKGEPASLPDGRERTKSGG